jgi:hypothetical protein
MMRLVLLIKHDVKAVNLALVDNHAPIRGIKKEKIPQQRGLCSRNWLQNARILEKFQILHGMAVYIANNRGSLYIFADGH